MTTEEIIELTANEIYCDPILGWHIRKQLRAAEDLMLVAKLTAATGTLKTLIEAAELYENAGKGE